MAYSSVEIRSFQGLFLQSNSFQVPDGAMEIANNIVIRSDEVISKTYGFFEFWRPLGLPNGDIVATYTFQGRIVGFFESGIGWFEQQFPGGNPFNSVGELHPVLDADTTYTAGMTFMEMNSNLYFTAAQGVYKLESYQSDADRAGAPPALGVDINYGLDGFTDDGILPPEVHPTASEKGVRKAIKSHIVDADASHSPGS